MPGVRAEVGGRGTTVRVDPFCSLSRAFSLAGTGCPGHRDMSPSSQPRAGQCGSVVAWRGPAGGWREHFQSGGSTRHVTRGALRKGSPGAIPDPLSQTQQEVQGDWNACKRPRVIKLLSPLDTHCSLGSDWPRTLSSEDPEFGATLGSSSRCVSLILK